MCATSADVRAPLTPLERPYFNRPTDQVARDLLGVWVVHSAPEGLSGGRIVETEAYGGPDDLASHARAGRTRRTAPMYGPVGHAYVYLIYGMHECLNVVAYHGSAAGAVLLRALEPVIGVDLMRLRRRREGDADFKLCAGPARLCQAMAVDRALDAHDLTSGAQLWISEGTQGSESLGRITEGTRIGVDYAGADWSARPLRFWLAGNPSVSRP